MFCLEEMNYVGKEADMQKSTNCPYTLIIVAPGMTSETWALDGEGLGSSYTMNDEGNVNWSLPPLFIFWSKVLSFSVSGRILL